MSSRPGDALAASARGFSMMRGAASTSSRMRLAVPPSPTQSEKSLRSVGGVAGASG